MKARTRKTNPICPPASGSDPPAANAPAALPARRRWAFRLAALCVPVLLLVLLEVLLWLFGFGYPTGFFLKSQVQGKPVYIENRDFTRRFFPPGLERTPEPVVIPAVKATNAVRIFIVGESAALGDPEPAFGFGRMLQVLLQSRFPESPIEVCNVAVTAINSHVIRDIAHDCARRQGDLWIVYMGNNEVVGPYGAGTVFSRQTPSLDFIRATLALKRTRVGQLLDALQWRLSRKQLPSSWEGMEMFLNQQVAHDDARLASTYTHFRRNLDDIRNTAERAGCKIVLSTVAGNLKDCPPFASRHREGLTEAQLAEWKRVFDAAVREESARAFAAAAELYRQAAAIDADYAELHYRLARCHLALARTNEALKAFEMARDLDTLRFRCDLRINEAIVEAARGRSESGLRLVDAVDVLKRASSNGIPGAESLFEHVHLNFHGNYVLARAFAEQAVALLADRLHPRVGQTLWLSEAECARRLAFTDWDRLQVLEELNKRLALAPFTNQLDHTNRMAQLRQEIAATRALITPAAWGPMVTNYQDAVARAPADWVLRENFARLLEAAGELDPAEQQWRKVIELAPQHVTSYFSLANLLDSRGRSAEAIPLYLEVLRRRPGQVEARSGLAMALSNLGRMTEALKQYEAALRQKPGFAEARVNLGQLYARQGDATQAIAQYELALRHDTNSTAAHINLGTVLSAQGKPREAIPHFETALRLKPDNAVAHFNLGNALAALNDPAALSHYAEAVRLSPDLAEPRYNYGLSLAQAARVPEAMEQFSAAIRLKPRFVGAHFNLGVALAKSGRYADAITNFQEVLRLDPANAPAQKFLEQAQARLERSR